MKSKTAIEQALAAIKELAAGPIPPEGVRTLRQALRSSRNRIVAQAASLAAEHQVSECVEDLAVAFDRLLGRSEETDKGCIGKLAIVDALGKLDYGDPEVYLRGIRHVQREPAYGPPVDTAANLRGNCAFALAVMGYPDIVFELVTLTADREVQARRAAIKALAYLGTRECELLLRMKALAGDPEPDVIGECLSGLIHVSPDRSLGFIETFMRNPDLAIAEGAALAIGESHLPQAYDLLQRYWQEDVEPEFREMLLLPMGLTRCDAAFEFLIGQVEESSRALAESALTALRVFGAKSERARRIDEAVRHRKDPSLIKRYQKEFGE
jgi:HEAT repeat protein